MVETETRKEDTNTSPLTGLQTSAVPEPRKTTGNPEFDDVGEEYLAEAVARLIRENKKVQVAILDFAVSSSNIKTEV